MRSNASCQTRFPLWLMGFPHALSLSPRASSTRHKRDCLNHALAYRDVCTRTSLEKLFSNVLTPALPCDSFLAPKARSQSKLHKLSDISQAIANQYVTPRDGPPCPRLFRRRPSPCSPSRSSYSARSTDSVPRKDWPAMDGESR